MRLKKTSFVLLGLLIVWAIVNPFLFTFKESDQGSVAAFKEKGLYIRFENYKHNKNNLHYARIGDSSKPVLLFVHGSPGSWVNSWDYLIDSAWHQDYELISIDRPGFGESDYGTAKNLFEQAEIITAFVGDKLAHRTVQLIGHSYGGPLVLQLCSNADSLFDRCIIMAGSVSPEAEENEWQLNLFSHPVLNWIAPGSFQQGILELLWLKDDLKSAKYLNGLAKMKTPIVAIYGTEDNMVPYEPNVDFLKNNFGEMHLHTRKGANHFLPWEEYDEMKKIIRSLQ